MTGSRVMWFAAGLVLLGTVANCGESGQVRNQAAFDSRIAEMETRFGQLGVGLVGTPEMTGEECSADGGLTVIYGTIFRYSGEYRTVDPNQPLGDLRAEIEAAIESTASAGPRLTARRTFSQDSIEVHVSSDCWLDGIDYSNPTQP